MLSIFLRRCETKQKRSHDLAFVTPPSNRMSTPLASGYAPKGASQPPLQLVSSCLTRRVRWQGTKPDSLVRKTRMSKGEEGGTETIFLQIIPYFYFQMQITKCIANICSSLFPSNWELVKYANYWSMRVYPSPWKIVVNKTITAHRPLPFFFIQHFHQHIMFAQLSCHL